MAVKVRCPECQRSFEPAPAEADRPRVHCPTCGAPANNPTWSQNSSSASSYDEPTPARRSERRSAREPITPPKTGRSVMLIVVVVVLLVLGCCGGLIGIGLWSVKPTSFPEPTQDYADARKAFKTKLVEVGPAPQTFEPETPPPGVKEIEYTSGNLKLKAWIDPPPIGGPLRPAVLYLHGGFAFGAEDWDQCEPFRKAGFVTMVPMLRGENGLPGSFSLFYNEVDDVMAAGDRLAATPGVDPKRLYLAGHSAGGTLTLLTAMTTRRFVKAASFSGSPDQVAFTRDQPELVPFDRDDPREFAMRSPLAYFQSFKCPVRMYYGNSELPFKFSTDRLASQARSRGADVQAVTVPGDHMSSVAPAMAQAIKFFQPK